MLRNCLSDSMSVRHGLGSESLFIRTEISRLSSVLSYSLCLINVEIFLVFSKLFFKYISMPLTSIAIVFKYHSRIEICRSLNYAHELTGDKHHPNVASSLRLSRCCQIEPQNCVVAVTLHPRPQSTSL